MIDKNNTICYIVDFRSNKGEIKKEFEETFGVRIASINTEITMKNTKRAYIRLKPEFKAADVARKLKLCMNLIYGENQMGKRLKQQRRGKGSNAYRKPPNTFKADINFRSKPIEGKAVGEVVEFIDDPEHSAPLMKVRYEDFSENTLLAPEGIKIGDRIHEGTLAEVTLGSILPLSTIPDGMLIYNIENRPGDGGRWPGLQEVTQR